MTVRVGVSVVVQRGGVVLMGLRKGAHGAGTWSFPGGHLELGESIRGAARRELLEETGIDIPKEYFERIPVFTNDIFEREKKHYVTLYALVKNDYMGELDPQVMEPDKCEIWQWWSYPPKNLFLPIENLIAQSEALSLFARLGD